MWAHETFPEITKRLRFASIRTARKVLSSYSEKDGEEAQGRMRKSFLETFLKRVKKPEVYGDRYIGAIFYPMHFPREQVKTDAANLYLMVFGGIAGADTPHFVKDIIDTRESVTEWISEWLGSTKTEVDKIALPLGIYLFYDIFNFEISKKENVRLTPIDGYDKIINGDFGRIDARLHDELILLKLGYLRQRDLFDEMEGINELELKTKKSASVKAIYHLQKGLAGYSRSTLPDYTKAMRHFREVGRIVQESGDSTRKMFDYAHKWMELLVSQGVKSKVYGDASFFDPDIPDQWQGWVRVLKSAYEIGMYELEKLAERTEGGIYLGDRWGRFYYDVERFRFWSHRSGFHWLDSEARKLRQRVFLSSSLGFEDQPTASYAFDEAIVIGDAKGVEAIARDRFPWTSRVEFENYVNWALESRRDRRALFGIMEFLAQYVFAIPEDLCLEVVKVAEEGIELGFSFVSDFDWGRPGIRLLSKIVQAEKGEASEKALKLIYNEYAIPFFSPMLVGKEIQTRNRAIRNEIARIWSNSITNLPSESAVASEIANSFYELDRDEIKKVVFSDREETDAWYSLLARDEAEKLVDRELRYWRSNEPALLEKEWLAYSPFVQKLTGEESNSLFREVIRQTGGADLEADINPPTVIAWSTRFPVEDPFTGGFGLFYFAPEELKTDWVRAMARWLLHTSRTVEELYQGWFSVLKRMINIKVCGMLKALKPPIIETAISYGAEGRWSYAEPERAEALTRAPSPSLLRFMARSVGTLYGIYPASTPLPYDEVFKRRGLSSDSGVALGICLGLVARETEDEKAANHYVDILSALINLPTSRVGAQAIYSLLWATKGPAVETARRLLNALLSDGRKRCILPIRVQIALDFVEKELGGLDRSP